MTTRVTSDDVSLGMVEVGELDVRKRNGLAWIALMGRTRNCQFCGHDISEHHMNSFPPYYFRPLGLRDLDAGVPSMALHPDDANALLCRVEVSEEPEIEFLYCDSCAGTKQTKQSLCYRRRLGTGEVVGSPDDCVRSDDPAFRAALAIARVLSREPDRAAPKQIPRTPDPEREPDIEIEPMPVAD